MVERQNIRRHLGVCKEQTMWDSPNTLSGLTNLKQLLLNLINEVFCATLYM